MAWRNSLAKPMRILVLHPHLNIKGGSERLTKVLLDGLSKLGQDIEFLLVTGVVTEDWFGKYAPRTRLLKLGMSPDELKTELGKIVQEFHPDYAIVMVQEPYYCYVVKEYSPRTKTCMYVHFPLDEEISEENLREYEKHLRYPRLTPRYISSPDVVVANARRTKLAIEMLWPCKVEVVYPCIDSIFFAEPDLERPRSKVILYVGRFNTLKRQDVLVLMFRKIKEEVPDAKLVLAGFVDPRHAEYYEHVKAIVESLADKYKDVELVVNPSDEKLLELYREAKVYAHPRIGEHFGMAPVEAMLQGAIVVIRLPTGLAEVAQHGVEAYFASSDYEFAEYIVKLLKTPDSDLVETRKRARKVAEKFTDVSFAKQVLEILTRA